MLTRQHYVLIARVIASEKEAPGNTPACEQLRANLELKRAILAQKFAEEFARDNPRFDRGRFLAACDLLDLEVTA